MLDVWDLVIIILVVLIVVWLINIFTTTEGFDTKRPNLYGIPNNGAIDYGALPDSVIGGPPFQYA